MSAISDFAAKQSAFNTQLETALEGISADIDSLNETIAALQASVGTVTPEDQALIDQLEATGKSLADRFTAVDELTPPKPPTP